MNLLESAPVKRVRKALEEAGREIAACNFRAGLEAGMSAAREANCYVADNAPWKLLKEDRERCATVLYTAIAAISGLKMTLYPFLPFTCEKLHGYLGGTFRSAVEDLIDRSVKTAFVLDNIRHALPTTWPQRVQELRELGDVPLANYLDETGLDLDDIYRGNHTWTGLRRAAGVSIAPAARSEERRGGKEGRSRGSPYH